MIRYREFAISTASLAGLSFTAACEPMNVNGDWEGEALVLYNGTTYDLPFSFDGTTTYESFFGGLYTLYFEEWTKDFSLSVIKGVGTFEREATRIYTYTYSYEGTVYGEGSIESTYTRSYSGPVTHVGPREFNIVLGLDDEETTLIINGEEQVEEDKESPTSQSAVLTCSPDGKELHCFEGDTLIVFGKQ